MGFGEDKGAANTMRIVITASAGLIKQSFWILCCLAFCICSTVASAQDKDAGPREQPIQEVFQGGLVYPQEHGEVQLSFSSRFSKARDHSSLENPFSIEYGITDRWQIELEWNALSRRAETGEATTRGKGDFSIGTKYSLMNLRGSNFHTAVGFEISFPSGSVEKQLSDGFIEYSPYVIVAKDFPRLHHLQLFTQAGVGFVQRWRRSVSGTGEEPAAHKFDLGLGMFVPFRVVVFTNEFNLSTNRWNNGGRQREAFATPGIVGRLPRGWQLGVGVPLGLTRDSNRFGTVVTLVYEFKLLGGSR